MFECVGLGDGLYQNDDGELDILLAPDSGLELLPGGEGVGGLNIIDEQRNADWASYTPICAHSAASVYTPWSNVGNAALNFRWVRIGNTVHVQFTCVLGSTTVFGAGSPGAMCFSMPVPRKASAPDSAIGCGVLSDNGIYASEVTIGVTDNHSYFYFIHTQWSTSVYSTSAVTGSSPFAWGNGDGVNGYITYEAA